MDQWISYSVGRNRAERRRRGKGKRRGGEEEQRRAPGRLVGGASLSAAQNGVKAPVGRGLCHFVVLARSEDGVHTARQKAKQSRDGRCPREGERGTEGAPDERAQDGGKTW